MKSKPRAQNSKTVPSDKLEMLYRGILDTALDCIITMGGDGRVLEFNPAAERVFGFSRSEAVGKALVVPGVVDALAPSGSLSLLLCRQGVDLNTSFTELRRSLLAVMSRLLSMGSRSATIDPA